MMSKAKVFIEPEPERNERAYIDGNRQAWASMLQKCCSELGYDTPEAQAASWVVEREAAISKLRDLCGAYGDFDWPENLHLADIIEKHLGRI